ncbi:unnamed protein product [Rotaria magnacalcarata]
MYVRLAHEQTPTVTKQGILQHLVSSVYSEMAAEYDQIWSSNMNCQNFARKFITEALGLNWPNTYLQFLQCYHGYLYCYL